MDVVDDLSVEYRLIDQLKPYRWNARTHPKKQIDTISQSIRHFGFTNPVLIDENDEIIAGHGRLLAAKQLQLEQVPTIRLRGLSELQKRGLRLADNKIASNASWDPDLLRIELSALTAPDVDFDIAVTGFSIGEINVTLNPGHDPDDDAVPEAPTEPRTKPGDIWVLGEHRLGCGDGGDRDFLRAVLGENEMVDAAFLDPPYNVKIGGHANIKSNHREFAMASGEMSQSEFQSFLRRTLGAGASVSRDGAVHFICMDWRHIDELSAASAEVYGDHLNVCVWNKSNAGMGSLYRSKHELIFVYKVGTAPHLNTVQLGKHGRNRTNVWDYASVNTAAGSRRNDLALHPTVKPVGLVADAIEDVTRHGDRVLDIFLGSGTTLIAAERVGRRCIGVEIDPAYVDVAIARWEAMTGAKAQRHREGVTP